jgi:hypothetical protein
MKLSNTIQKKIDSVKQFYKRHELAIKLSPYVLGMGLIIGGAIYLDVTHLDTTPEERIQNVKNYIEKNNTRMISTSEYPGYYSEHKIETFYIDYEKDGTVDEKVTVHHLGNKMLQFAEKRNHLIRNDSLETIFDTDSTRIMTSTEADSIDNIYQTLLQIRGGN